MYSSFRYLVYRAHRKHHSDPRHHHQVCRTCFFCGSGPTRQRSLPLNESRNTPPQDPEKSRVLSPGVEGAKFQIISLIKCFHKMSPVELFAATTILLPAAL